LGYGDKRDMEKGFWFARYGFENLEDKVKD
jgi:hypothetical protein